MATNHHSEEETTYRSRDSRVSAARTRAEPGAQIALLAGLRFAQIGSVPAH
jgi:hypothetical protein